MFHVTPEGERYKKGINWWRAPGWVRLVFFCGDCRLYLRFRWSKRDPGSYRVSPQSPSYRPPSVKFSPRLFFHWDLLKNEEPARHFVWTGEEFVPCGEKAEDDAVKRLMEETKGPYERK